MSDNDERPGVSPGLLKWLQLFLGIIGGSLLIYSIGQSEPGLWPFVGLGFLFGALALERRFR